LLRAFQPSTGNEVLDDPLLFRHGFALCPYSSEAVFRYVNFLLQFNRFEDARLLARTAVDVDPKNNTFKDLLQNIQKMQTR
jgi:hypothetical protein